MQHELDEVAIARAAETERLRVFNERSIVGAISALAGVMLLAWVLWIAVGVTRAAWWATGMLTIELIIFGVGLRCRRALSGLGNPERWRNVQIVLAGLAGVSWGSAAWYGWLPGGDLNYLAIMSILVGVAGISMVTMAAYAPASVLYYCGINLMPLAHVLLHDTPMTGVLAAGLLVALVVQLGYSHELGRVMVRDASQNARNVALLARLNELVTLDPLTGAYSRRYTFDRLEQLVAARQRHGSCASLVMFDLDHFKAINDAYGHPTGDRALRTAVSATNGQLRAGDALGRIGGEEFLVVLPQTDTTAALQLAERLRLTMADTVLLDGTATIRLPASFGVAELKPAESAAEWFRRVDRALYQAKAAGRNRVVVAD